MPVSKQKFIININEKLYKIKNAAVNWGKPLKTTAIIL
jgi:hypothetical protein